MFKHYFEIIEGIDIYPIISLLVFFLFFIGVTAYLFLIDKSYIKEMENLPLEKDGSENESDLIL
ncbi:MAG: hypothetical protein HGGPFJEG_02084 [Ignavibacteria bacterium]|nr:hypothetical protein [Ignavibacteria bacterium]